MRQRSGFTLVELSIVLVIIGLLIGGILAAQSMISMAKINAQVQQIGQFDAMVFNFKDTYRYLPGDAPTFGGDGDGLIELTARTCCDNNITAFAGEISAFWSSMDSRQFPGTAVYGSPGAQTNSSGPSKNVPLSKLGASGSFVIASALGVSGELANTSSPENYYAILASSQAHSLSPVSWYHFAPTTVTNSAVTPSDLLALDTKMDDGIANSGSVLSGSIGPNPSYPFCGGIVPTALPECSVGASYAISNNGDACTPLIRIGGSVGNPQ